MSMFSIDFQTRMPIYEQIVNQVEKYIVLGLLKANEQLPSVRQVAFDLGINPNTIQRAYAELERKGVIVSVVGKGTFVKDKIDDIIDSISENITILKSLGLSDKEIKNKILKDQE